MPAQSLSSRTLLAKQESLSVPSDTCGDFNNLQGRHHNAFSGSGFVWQTFAEASGQTYITNWQSQPEEAYPAG